MRAVEPAIEDVLDRGGSKVGYAVWGRGPTTVVFAPAWLPVDSRLWKAQVPYLARHFRVITVEPRGNGRSDRPRDPAAFADVHLADDLVAAMDAVGVDRAVVAGLSLGAWRSIIAAARHPERFDGLIALSPTIPHLLDEPTAALANGTEAEVPPFEAVRETYEGWDKFNRHYWREHYGEFLEFFFTTAISEPHSTKQIEDCITWGLGSDGEILAAAEDGSSVAPDRAATEALIGRLRCPVLVIHGDEDAVSPFAVGERLSELTGGSLIALGGGGHALAGRHPVAINRWMRDFVRAVNPPPAAKSTVDESAPQRWTHALKRSRRVLYLCSPIGLGHARRDIAIVDRLRARHPDLTVDWLAQPPVTAALAARGERIHPASRWLASESAHWESEAQEHDLHAFQAVRRMDEILVANFMVFADIVEQDHYDLWVGDESWEVDYFLHENPELKRAPYAWITDFVGWLPMPDGGASEAALTTDYNAEMIEQIARYPQVRDRALFVGNPQDVVPDRFGTDAAGGRLPAIRDWTAEHYDFTGYITGFDPAEIADRSALRAEFGWEPHERVCLVTVGGTGVGEHLLRRVIAAFPLAAARLPGLRMVVVTGPRIDPRRLPTHPRLQLCGYLPDLHRRLAACDLAVVQGGLTTTMELTAANVPFLYVPLDHHFEQQFHVPHRLRRYGAGRRIDYADTTPERLAAAIVDEISRPAAYHAVETDGADRAATFLAELL